MTKPKPLAPKPNRIFTKHSPEHETELRELRKQLDNEKPQLIAEARAKHQQAKRQRAKLCEIFLELKAERLKRGLSLADLASRSGMAREVIHRLETLTTPNPTIGTVQRYAEALDLEVRLELVKAS